MPFAFTAIEPALERRPASARFVRLAPRRARRMTSGSLVTRARRPHPRAWLRGQALGLDHGVQWMKRELTGSGRGTGTDYFAAGGRRAHTFLQHAGTRSTGTRGGEGSAPRAEDKPVLPLIGTRLTNGARDGARSSRTPNRNGRKLMNELSLNQGSTRGAATTATPFYMDAVSRDAPGGQGLDDDGLLTRARKAVRRRHVTQPEPRHGMATRSAGVTAVSTRPGRAGGKVREAGDGSRRGAEARLQASHRRGALQRIWIRRGERVLRPQYDPNGAASGARRSSRPRRRSSRSC